MGLYGAQVLRALLGSHSQVMCRHSEGVGGVNTLGALGLPSAQGWAGDTWLFTRHVGDESVGPVMLVAGGQPLRVQCWSAWCP